MSEIVVTLDVADAKRTARGYAQASRITREQLEAGMTEIGALLEREIGEATPVGASGLLRRAWSNEVLSGETLSEVSARVFNPLIYAAPIEFGTRPHTPPIAPLIDWVNAKLDLQGEDAEDVARRIQFSIARRGTKPQLPATNTLAAQRGQIEEILGAQVVAIVNRLHRAGEA